MKRLRSEWFSLTLDESTDISDTSQLLLFIRRVSSNFEVTEELASVHSGEQPQVKRFFKEVEKSLSQYNLQWKQLNCVTADGGRHVCVVQKKVSLDKFTKLVKVRAVPSL
ncbi:unnamed protein product [Natator depressus]